MLVTVSSIFVAALALNLADAQDSSTVKYYASKYDHLDVNVILNNRRMVNYYAKCILNQGPCPPQGSELKGILPEALTTNCGRCSEKQRTVAYYAIKRMKKEYPKIWDQMKEVYDPFETAITKFEAGFEKPQPPKEVTTTVMSLDDRFGAEDDSDNNIAPPAVPAVQPLPSPSPPVVFLAPYPPALPVTSSTSTSTTPRPRTTTSSAKRPSANPPSFTTRRPGRPPIRDNLGANIQATVSFITKLKNVVCQLYQTKLETFNRILSGI